MRLAGLSAANREFVAELNRALPGPFTPAQAAEATGTDHARATRLLRHLAEEGWLARIQRGLYTTIPLEAEDPHAWKADPWAVAAAALAPGYIGGWTALHHWDLTDQIFSTTVFLTARPVPRRRRTIGNARFELRHRSEGVIFGTSRVWRDGVPVEISDRERTLLDCFDEPSLGGGLAHVAEAFASFAEDRKARWGVLIGYGDRLDNRTAFKRMGYVAETLGLADTGFVEACLRRVSAGIGRLDPSKDGFGPIVSRWGLRINTRVDG